MGLFRLWVRCFVVYLALGLLAVYGLHWHPQCPPLTDRGFVVFQALIFASVFTWFVASEKARRQP